MAKKKFRSGDKLKAIHIDTDDNIIVDKTRVLDIEIIMENGQMAGVPWAYVTYADEENQKWNLAMCQGVTLPKVEA